MQYCRLIQQDLPTLKRLAGEIVISDQLNDNIISIKGLVGQGAEGIKSLLELLFNLPMKVEREAFLGV